MQEIGVYTTTLSTSITIAKSDNIREVTVLATSGPVTVTGNKHFRSASSTPVSLSTGQSLTISSPYGQGVLSDIVINATGGSAQIVMIS